MIELHRWWSLIEGYYTKTQPESIKVGTVKKAINYLNNRINYTTTVIVTEFKQNR